MFMSFAADLWRPKNCWCRIGALKVFENASMNKLLNNVSKYNVTHSYQECYEDVIEIEPAKPNCTMDEIITSLGNRLTGIAKLYPDYFEED